MSGIGIFARVRPLMPWEQGEIDIVKTTDTTIKVQCPTKGVRNQIFEFTRIMDKYKTNEQCFDLIAKPMCEKVLDGYNAVCIAYGQTGCGKTYTMMGKTETGIRGLIPRSIEYLFTSKNTPDIYITVIEAYSKNIMKIELYDLLSPKNDTDDWDEKFGSTTLGVDRCTKIKINDADEGKKMIQRALKNGHTAATGKNPDSSRGHTLYIINVEPTNDANSLELTDPATLVFCDLAGSEGETALTPRFVASASRQEILDRRMEAGVINSGLIDIRQILKELRDKGELKQWGNKGVRRVLSKFINRKTSMNIIFALSPASKNYSATTSTLNFAKHATAIRVVPEKAQKRVNWPKVAEVQKEEILTLKAQIEELKFQLKTQPEKECMLSPVITESNHEIKDFEYETPNKKFTRSMADIDFSGSIEEIPDDLLERSDSCIFDLELINLNKQELLRRAQLADEKYNEECQKRICVEEKYHSFATNVANGMEMLGIKLAHLEKTT